MRRWTLACICASSAILTTHYAWVTPTTVRLRGGFGRSVTSTAAESTSLVKEPAPRLGQGYAVISVCTLLAWTLTAIMALARHPLVKLHPLRHNVLTVAQALTPLPLGCAVLGSLTNSASTEGWWAMNRMTYRRLNLAVFTLSIWLAAAAAFTSSFARGFQLYHPQGVAYLVAGCHIISAAFCLVVWLKSVTPSPRPIAGQYLPRLVRGIVGSFWAVFPATSETSSISSSGSASHLDDPESTAGSDGRNEYSLATVLFLCFAVMPFLVSFPIAGVGTLSLGPLSRAGAAWTFLAAVVAYVLKDATQRGRIHSGKTFRLLRWGLVASSGSHLVLVLLTLAGIDGGRAALMKFYPGTMSCLKLALCSLVMHGLAVFAALTPPPKVAKVASTAAVSAASAVSEAPAMTATVAEVPEAPPMAAAPAVAPDGAFNLNQRVLFRGQGGTVRYIGETNVGVGEWIGVEMDEEIGTHDGSLFGVRYFTCADRHGVFAQTSQLQAA